MQNFNYIYFILNKVDGKYYVGKTSESVEKRWNHHVWCASNRKDWFYFHRALRKYGSRNFEVRTLFKGVCSKEELNSAERYFIEYFESNNSAFGYNIAGGGEGSPGTIVSQETREKKRQSMIGKLAGTKSPNYKRPKTKEELQKLREANIGDKNPFYGRKHSEESKTKIRNSKKKRREEVISKF